MSRWKLADDQSEFDYDEMSSLGEFFAKAIAEGSHHGNNGHKKKAYYPEFRKTFWEERLYNPAIGNTHIDHAFDALDREQQKAWRKNGYKWSLSSDVRFRDNAYNNPGALKPDRFPQCFEKPIKHWGRERKINPYNRAKVYTRPNDRCKPWAKLTLLEEMADLGPGRYDVPDEWSKAAKPVCGVVRPSSFMTSKTPKGLQIKPAVGQEGFESSTSEVEGDIPITRTPIKARNTLNNLSRSGPKRSPDTQGFTFPRGSKSAMDAALPIDLPVYHIRVKDIATGSPLIIAVNSLTEPLPTGFINQETWANECLDGGSSLTLKKEPLPPLNPLERDIDVNVPDVALVPHPVTPLKRTKPCSPIQVKQMHLTTGTDILIVSPEPSPERTKTVGSYIPAMIHSLQPASENMNEMLDEKTAEVDASGIIDWNHPIAKLHLPTPVPRSKTVAGQRPKTIGQRLQSRENKTMDFSIAQSNEPFSFVTNRSRSHYTKFKKIPMHVADVASIRHSEGEPTITEKVPIRHSKSLQDDSLGALSVSRKLRDSIPTATANSSAILNNLSPDTSQI